MSKSGFARGVLVMLALTLMMAGAAIGQNSKIRKADQFYDAGGYAEAVALYRENLITVPKDQLPEYLYKVAECYRKMGNPRQAELAYQKAIMRGATNPKAHLYYANALLSNGTYELAKEEYEEYKKLVPDDKLADYGLEAIELAKAWQASPSGYVVQPAPMLNTHQNDYSPSYASSDYRTLLLTSSRKTASGKNTHAATGEKFSDIFVSFSNGEGRWSKPKPLVGSINTNFEEGATNLKDDFTALYFTRCRMSKKGKLGCQIFEAPQTGEGWDNPQLIPIAADSLIVAHPAISADGLTLYFTSDLPGGYGGLDIWKVTRDDPNGAWGEPTNLGGNINTAGDEVFPYSHADGTLYFSSDGWPGMGGLDIFKAIPDGDGWRVENMRYPINSSVDDFGITFRKDREEGFFTSRRKGKGARGGDDIYWFYLPPLEFNLIGKVIDAKQDQPLVGSKVKLVGSDGSVQVTETGKKGDFRFMLNPNTDYVAIASGKNFLNGKLKVSTKGKTVSEDIQMDVSLTSIKQPIVLPNIFYDFNSWELRPESEASLARLVEILQDNPGLVIELGSHTDSRGTAKYNLELSQRRAQSVVNYLIEHGIPSDRLRAKGYADQEPFVVDQALHNRNPFLPVGQKLTQTFIETLPSEKEQEAAYEICRRTQFRVIRNDYDTKK